MNGMIAALCGEKLILELGQRLSDRWRCTRPARLCAVPTERAQLRELVGSLKPVAALLISTCLRARIARKRTPAHDNLYFSFRDYAGDRSRAIVLTIASIVWVNQRNRPANTRSKYNPNSEKTTGPAPLPASQSGQPKEPVVAITIRRKFETDQPV